MPTCRNSVHRGAVFYRPFVRGDEKMNKKIITACAAALLMAACAGAWLAYHHANPKTDRLEFEYGDPLDIEAETLIRSPNPAIADTVEIDLSAIEREEDGTAAAGSWDASFTYTDVFGTHTS